MFVNQPHNRTQAICDLSIYKITTNRTLSIVVINHHFRWLSDGPLSFERYKFWPHFSDWFKKRKLLSNFVYLERMEIIYSEYNDKNATVSQNISALDCVVCWHTGEYILPWLSAKKSKRYKFDGNSLGRIGTIAVGSKWSTVRILGTLQSECDYFRRNSSFLLERRRLEAVMWILYKLKINETIDPVHYLQKVFFAKQMWLRLTYFSIWHFGGYFFQVATCACTMRSWNIMFFLHFHFCVKSTIFGCRHITDAFEWLMRLMFRTPRIGGGCISIRSIANSQHCTCALAKSQKCTFRVKHTRILRRSCRFVSLLTESDRIDRKDKQTSISCDAF